MDAPHTGAPLPWWYVVLQVSPDASRDEITTAYRRLAAENHPDRQRTEAERTSAAARMKTILAAFARALQDCEGRPSADPDSATVDDEKVESQTDGSAAGNPTNSSGRLRGNVRQPTSPDRREIEQQAEKPPKPDVQSSTEKRIAPISAGVAKRPDATGMDGVAASFGFVLIVAIVAVGLYSAMNNGVSSTVTAKPDTPPHSKSQPFKTPQKPTPPDSVRPAPPFKSPPKESPPNPYRPAPHSNNEDRESEHLPLVEPPPIPLRTSDKALAESKRRLGFNAYHMYRYRAAIDMYNAALKRDPDNLNALNELAWLRATCPDAKFRDADRAVELSEHLLELVRKSGQPEWYHLGTGAAAHAEHGDFDVAVRLQKQSIARTPDEYIAAAKRRLRLYENHKPFHGGPNDR